MNACEDEGDADRFESRACGGDAVVRTGKFFEVGKEFTDRNGVRFGISADEADERIRRFRPKAINLQHVSTIFDGLLGRIVRLWRDGADIMAEFEIPSWLHELTKGAPLKISSEWDLVSKEPLAAALVLHPALEDAFIRAAFGAMPATGSFVEPSRTVYSHHEENMTHTMPDTTSLLEKIRALLPRGGAPESDPAAIISPAASSRAEVEALARQVAEIAAESRLAEATAFAERMVRDRRALPAEQPALIAAYARAAQDDASYGGTLRFALPDGGASSMSRVEILKAIYAARPDHALTVELLRDSIALAAANSQELTALFSQSTTPDPEAEKPLDEQRRRTLHRMTPLGQSIIDRK